MNLKHRNPKLPSDFFLIILFFIPLIFSCKDDLPRETQDGRNTLGMLVNGEKWETSLNDFFDITTPTAFYYSHNKTLIIEAKRNTKSLNERLIFYVKNITGEKKYSIGLNFGGESPCYDSTSFQPNAFQCTTKFGLLNELDGEVEITKLDTIKSIVSGRFKLDLFKDVSKSNILKITEGRFDIRLNKL